MTELDGLSSGLRKKYDALRSLLRQMGSAAVAFSAGVDSTLLLQIAHDVLAERAVAVTVCSCFLPPEEAREAAEFCTARGIDYMPLSLDVLSVEGVRENPDNRCYLCKKAVFSAIRTLAEQRELAWVIEGSNSDDLRDYRPGMAALRELEIRSPLLETGFTKNEIRTLSKALELPAWDKPAMACLATRFPAGVTITEEGLSRVARSEKKLRELGFHQLRVRCHGDLARLELEQDEMSRLLQPGMRVVVERELLALGFRYAALDLGGYRMGSMNRLFTRKNEDSVTEKSDGVSLEKGVHSTETVL